MVCPLFCEVVCGYVRLSYLNNKLINNKFVFIQKYIISLLFEYLLSILKLCLGYFAERHKAFLSLLMGMLLDSTGKLASYGFQIIGYLTLDWYIRVSLTLRPFWASAVYASPTLEFCHCFVNSVQCS